MSLHTVASRVAAALVAAVAGFASYRHIYTVAVDAGEHQAVAAVLPLAIDGLIIVATLAMWDDKRNNRHPRASARFALVFGIAATLAANIASAEPTVTARLVAAVPAVSFLLAVEVLARVGKPRVRTERVPLAEPAGEPEPAMIEPANGEIDQAAGALSSSEATDPREAARKAYRESVAEGAPLSGAELARRFGMSARWGVDRVNEVRREHVNGRRPELVEVP